MIRVAGHSRNTGSRVFPEDAARPLFVNCCGYQHFKTKDFSIQRTGGRPDYQLLYISKGCGHFFIGNEWKTIPAGSIVLYHPMDPQVYTYYAKDAPEIYWIHFLGVESESLIEKYHIRSGFIGNNRTLNQLFEEIILELQLRKPLFQEIALADFHKLLALINRLYLSQFSPTEKSALIDQLVAHLNKHYMENWNIRLMADYCHLSTDYFSHLFTKTMGCPPIQYLNQLRVERAQELLLAERLSVSEVAELVGYKDPLYFSKVFKKATGTSPKMFHGNRWQFDGSVD